MIQYHDEEWGVPVHDDLKLFEFLVLEGAQAGLSWETVLKKRENYREAFHGFDPVKVARCTEQDVERLMGNPGIIRNRLKIRSAINNAQRFLEVQKEFGSFDAYVWKFTNGRVIDRNTIRTNKDYPAISKESDELSKDLKRRGFSFVGSTIMYAYMQATGMVNDHSVDCYKRKK